MKITREHVLHVATLAHLDLSDAEIEMYRQQLDSILEYMGKLNELDVTNVEPMAQSLAGTSEGSALREDIPVHSDVADAVLQVAPDPGKPFFRVPKVIDR